MSYEVIQATSINFCWKRTNLKIIDDLHQRDAPQAKKYSWRTLQALVQVCSYADKTRRLSYELYVIDMKSNKTRQFDQYE